MKIGFKEVEMAAGLKMFIESQGICLEGKTVDIKFTAGRGASGFSAVVDITATEQVATTFTEFPGIDTSVQLSLPSSVSVSEVAIGTLGAVLVEAGEQSEPEPEVAAEIEPATTTSLFG